MNKNGQSIIEYALIVVLVILGIVYMGPYVLRSVNAHFKLWGDSAQDSLSEKITQAPVDHVPDLSLNCVCPTAPGACGGASAGYSSGCAANEREIDYNCTPQGCNGSSAPFYCKPDSTCCEQYYVQGCGTMALNPGTPATIGPPTGSIPSTATNGLPTTCVTYTSNNTSSSPGCYYGQRIWATQCASSSDTPIACCPDNTCVPACLGLNSPGVAACSGSPTTQATGLTQTQTVNYVAGASSCDHHTPCQVYCINGYVLNASGTGCTNTFQVAMNVDMYGLTGGAASGNCSGTTVGCSGDTGCGNGTIQSCVFTTSGEQIITTNTCSFCMCSAKDTVLSNPVVTDVTSPETAPYCGNPGNPGEECEVTYSYY